MQTSAHRSVYGRGGVDRRGTEFVGRLVDASPLVGVKCTTDSRASCRYRESFPLSGMAWA